MKNKYSQPDICPSIKPLLQFPLSLLTHPSILPDGTGRKGEKEMISKE